MPVRKRVDRRKSAVPPFDVELDLDIGWLSNRTEDEMREAWQQYRGHIMAQNAQYHPGLRPYAWWIFDAGREAPDTRDQADVLFEMDELDDAEIVAIQKEWRGHPGGPKFLQDI
jgi:hypothetical protein